MTCANIDYMNRTIRGYFSDTRHHDVNSTYKARAKEFIFNEFQRFGLAAEYQDFMTGGNRFTNVIGVFKGANFGKEDDRIIGVLAHYDTVMRTKGVDDNGAGVAAMLEAARQLQEKKLTTKHTVIFVSPDLEEGGLVGSKKFVTDWLPAWTRLQYGNTSAVLKTMQGFIVLDTMMEFNTTDQSQQIPKEAAQLFQQFFPDALNSIKADDYEGDFLALIYRDDNGDTTLAKGFRRSWKEGGRPEFEIESFSLPAAAVTNIDTIAPEFGNFLRSDHARFWEANLTAVFITDTANFRGDMINCYHAQCDNLDVMLTEDNLRFLGKTADTLASTINTMAGVTETSGNRNNMPSGLLIFISSLLIFLFCM